MILWKSSVILFCGSLWSFVFSCQGEEIVYVPLLNCFQMFSCPFSNWLCLYLFLFLLVQVLDNPIVLSGICHLHRHCSHQGYAQDTGPVTRPLETLLGAGISVSRTDFKTVSFEVCDLMPYFPSYGFVRLNKILH